MGKNSSSTTKGGKYMNPADRARKDARKKELKKNKKQRQIVRETILKQRDAFKLLEELEALDKTLYDPVNRPKLHESVLREKRRKLKSDFDRVLRFYTKENTELAADIRKAEGEYERRRVRLEQYFEQVKHAERVQLDDIPLPSELPPTSEGGEPAAAILPSVASVPQKSILKSRQSGVEGLSGSSSGGAFASLLRGRKLPLPPPGPPPELPEVTDEELERAEAQKGGKSVSRRSRFDSDPIDEPADNSDTPHSGTKRLRFVDDSEALPTVIEPSVATDDVDIMRNESDASAAPQGSRFVAPPMPFPGSFMPPFNRPPPPMPRFGPPGPHRFPMHGRLPPPPSMHPHGPHVRMAPATVSYSAPPTIARQSAPSAPQQVQTGNVVEAKPMMKNLRSDVVRLMPTNLQIRRDEAAGQKGGRISMRRSNAQTANYLLPNVPPSNSQSTALAASQIAAAKPAPSKDDVTRRTEVPATKDDAYEKFMREISGLL